ncbi:hypothetical protein JCM3765_000866 [Sporobolomyces pararoseus]
MSSTAINKDLSLLLKHYSALTPSIPSFIPSPSPFPDSKTLSLPQTQQWIVRNLLPLDNPDNEEENGQEEVIVSDSSWNWKKSFWKRVVKGIEEGFELRKKEEEEGEVNVEDEEVDSEILERMVEYLSTPSTITSTENVGGGSSGSSAGFSNRTYYWGDLNLKKQEWNSIKTREEGRMISGGTTGLRTWQACIALGNRFLFDPSTIESFENIIELGSGVGVLSLICAKIKQNQIKGGKGKIIATDVDEKVLELLKQNVKLNESENRIKTLKLDWELAQIASSEETCSSSEAQAELQEWELEAFGGEEEEEGDLIIGADIVYDPSLTSQLAATISYLLSRSSATTTTRRSNSQAIIAGTIRNESTWESFLNQCRCRELKIEEIELKKFKDGSGLVGAEGYEGEGVVRVVRLTL